MAVEFDIRKVGKYYDVNVTVNDIKHNLGFMDADERKELAQHLSVATSELLDD